MNTKPPPVLPGDELCPIARLSAAGRLALCDALRAYAVTAGLDVAAVAGGCARMLGRQQTRRDVDAFRALASFVDAGRPAELREALVALAVAAACLAGTYGPKRIAKLVRFNPHGYRTSHRRSL